jgi:serine/threonine protein kinase
MQALLASDPPNAGPFRLKGRLGVGGMGTVYAAEDDTGMRAAVKIIHPHLLADPSFRSRFSREAALLARVGGYCTARVLLADTQGVQPFIAIEYIAGPTLAERVMAHEGLAGQELHSLAVGLLEALGSIHAVGIVHRDLKPSNIILSDRAPMVIDFGIARLVGGTAMTTSGVALGTPGWMAPEQFDGPDVGTAADIFAWAATVAFAASGRPPFGEGRLEAVYMRAIRGQADLDSVPQDWQEVLRSCLSPAPGDRPTLSVLLDQLVPGATVESATAVTSALLRSTWSLPVHTAAWPSTPRATTTSTARPVTTLLPAPPPRRRRRRGMLLGAAAATAVAVLGGAAAAVLAADLSPQSQGTVSKDAASTTLSPSTSPTSVTRAPASASASATPQPPATHAAPTNSPVIVEPAAATKPPIDSFTMTLSGLGALRIGSSVARIQSTYGGLDFDEGADGSCLQSGLLDFSSQVGVLVEYGSLSYIDSTDPRVHTPSGITIGSPRALVEQVFASGLVEDEQHPYDSHVIVLLASLPGEANSMYFAIENDRVIEMRVGRPEAVNYAEGCF